MASGEGCCAVHHAGKPNCDHISSHTLQIKQKEPQDHKTIFETLPLPVAKMLSPVAKQAPTKVVRPEKWDDSQVGFQTSNASNGCIVLLPGAFWARGAFSAPDDQHKPFSAQSFLRNPLGH